MINNKLFDNKSIQLKTKDGKVSYRQKKRKHDLIPQLVIDLQDEKSFRNSLSSWSNNYSTNTSVVSQKQRDNNKENTKENHEKHKIVSLRNTSSLKTKHNQNLRQQLEFLKSQNQALKSQNLQLKCKIVELQDNQKLLITQQILNLKQQLQKSQIQTFNLEQKYIKGRVAYQQVCEKTRNLYQRLLKEKRWQKQLSSIVLTLDKQDVINDTMFKSEQQFQTETRIDYYGGSTIDDRQFYKIQRKQFQYDHNF